MSGPTLLRFAIASSFDASKKDAGGPFGHHVPVVEQSIKSREQSHERAICRNTWRTVSHVPPQPVVGPVPAQLASDWPQKPVTLAQSVHESQPWRKRR